MIDKIINKYFRELSALIILLASFLRFYLYSGRFGIAYDQAHDALVARFAVASHSFPLVGPFSSGAQFQASGIWYWFLMVPTFLAKNILIAPWVFTTLFCIGFVAAIIFAGQKIVDRKFALIAGIFAAISTSQIGQSTNLSLTALISTVSLFTIYFAYKYLEKPKMQYIFLFGFFVSATTSIHLQGLLLYAMVPIFLVLTKLKSPKAYLFLFLGLAAPFTTLVIFDLQNNFVNSTGLVFSLLNKQNQVSYEVLGRRWLTYIGVFWPTAWATIIGGYIIPALILIVSVFIVFGKTFKEQKIAKIWILIAATFIADVILSRYVKSPLFDSYLNFLHPFIIFMCAFAVYQLFKWKKIAGIILLLIVVCGSLMRDYGEVTHLGNVTTISSVNQMKDLIDRKYPNKQFDFYDYDYKQVGESLPLVLIYDVDGKTNSTTGQKIGIISTEAATVSAKLAKKVGDAGGFTIVDLSSSDSADLVRSNWHPINPYYIYNNTENWYKK